MTKRPYVSFAEIKEKVPIPDALTALGIADGFQRRGDALTGVCPLPSHSHGPSPNPDQFKINRKDGVWLWHCFGDCQRGGDVIELVKAVTGHDNAHVRFWFAENFGDRLTLGNSDKVRAKETRVEKDTARESSQGNLPQAAPNAPSNLLDEFPELKPLRFRLDLDPNVPYLRGRGLTPEIIARYGLGLCRRGLLKGYVAIPVYGYPHLEGANPLAYLGRWPGEDYDEAAGRPRYKWPEGFPKSRVVFGLSQALKGTEGTPLIIVEGPFSVFHLTEVGYPNAVAVFGSAISDEQATILISCARPIVVLFDGDEAGMAGAETAVNVLSRRTFVRNIELPDGRSPDEISEEVLHNLFN